MTSDPTQRLLTSLGRFHRQFIKARNGAPQEQWSDECMNYLIQSVEIAVEQRWQDLVEALTETGRVLHTYEAAGRANECVAFLADSYEIMCLMVGDLIVDKPRSGVIRKWRERYASALEDLNARGLTLIRDDEDTKPARGNQAAAKSSPPLRVVDPEPELTEDDAADDVELVLGDVPDVDGERRSDSSPFAEEDLSLLAASAPMPVLELPPDEPEATTNIEAAIAQPARKDVADVLDHICDCLVRIEQEDESRLSPVFAEMKRGLNELAQRADDHAWAGSRRACEAMRRITELVERHNAARDDRYFELAYAFGGVYGDAMQNIDDAILKNWVAECDDFLAFWQQRPVEPPPIPVQPAPADPVAQEAPFEISTGVPSLPARTDVPSLEDVWGADSVEDDDEIDATRAAAHESEVPQTAEEPLESDDPASHLLETARRAVAHGSIADAKLLAMQAAASIARAQAAEAEARVRLAESRIQEGMRAIEDARNQVQQFESVVTEAESRVNERRSTLLERGRHTQAMQSTLDGIDSRIADLERRIRELEAQRDEALRQRGAAMEALDEARSQETGAKGTLEEALSAEQSARIRLEDARQSVKLLQRRQAENESAMERAREALNRQRASVADIEQTIEQIRTAEGATGAGGDEMLF